MLSNKKASTLVAENLIFIILNVLFFVILVIFIINQGSSESSYEKTYSKQIALLIDSAKPGMILKLNMAEGKEIADSNDFDFSRVVSINGNSVNVKLSERTGHSYEFFNDVNVSYYPDELSDGRYNSNYIFTINSKEPQNE